MYNNEVNPSKIIGIQFSILSPEEIRNSSVTEITSRETYINNKPVINGLFDPRMGVQDPAFICPTDGGNYLTCPGYFGHIEMARPVFYIQYLNTILKILRVVCYKCSKLLISKSKYIDILDGLSNESRWNKVFALASKITRCGDDCDTGCGCKQPKSIKKEGLATLIASWENLNGETKENVTLHLNCEMVLKILSRISDEDTEFMGFSSSFSRPEWMICQVFAVPPPCVRPSVKHDAQQRSEDDLSHIIVNIIKANNTLQDKININAPSNIIDDWTTMLQYYVATCVDNKIPGVGPVAQRSGRPLKSIKERLNGKTGRVRGNLMGKRVDFSARSVITPDPNLSIKELGIPMKIAMNITKPIYVNSYNKNFLKNLIINGPDVYPGAKILEKKNKQNISLRYIDRENVILEEGDIVHRHMMDGDHVLFNRQPTLHRMSMMCHVAKIMSKGDTFRMNVADTKPYNADFDGDEMNLHMPQDIISELELKHLAAVPYQIISPANNQSIVGIFQDSLLGAYRFTRENIVFNKRDAMNLLMLYPNINYSSFSQLKDTVTSFDILTQIMPNISLKYKTKSFKADKDKYETSNNVLEINNGNVKRGQLDKKAFGSTTSGLLQRILNDLGHDKASDFIDDFQNIINEYMKTSGYSVGINDLRANKTTCDKIIKTINDKKQEVNNLIHKSHIGIFENKTGKTNVEELETQVNKILNQAASDAGKIGRNSLDKDNRFVIMVNAGSKGSDLNISQMIATLGQQNVDGKRIPYGFESRTLPHYSKFDDSPEARGFVESSFIHGLSPAELFFHAQGGRVGLIDTAVKTSQTGYIQRRLIKGMEDLVVAYDMTVRNNKNKIVQFRYGNDSFDTVNIELQHIPFIEMNINDFYNHYNIPNEKLYELYYSSNLITKVNKQKDDMVKINNILIKELIEIRAIFVNNVFNNTNETKVYSPVAFKHIINNIQQQQHIQSNSFVDITPLEAYNLIKNKYNNLIALNYAQPNLLFKILYYYYLSPKELLFIKRFNKKTLIILLDYIEYIYKKAIIAPGEMVGMIAAQSIGEPTTQMTLNTFHFAGVASKSNVTKGVPRVEEILSLSENLKSPSLTISLQEEDNNNLQKVKRIGSMIEHTILKDLVLSSQIFYKSSNNVTSVNKDNISLLQYLEFENILKSEIKEIDSNEYSNWVIQFEFDKEILLEKNITMDDIHFSIKSVYKNNISCCYSDYNSDKLLFNINKIDKKSKQTKNKPLDQSDEIYKLIQFQDDLLENISLRGIKNIDKVILRKQPNKLKLINGNYEKTESWVLDTIGSNLLDVLALDYIDKNNTITNNIIEVYKVLGIEAARNIIYDEFIEVLADNDTYINEHHLMLLCDRMTHNYKMTSIFRHGINNDDIGPLAKASFEETPEQFLKAARHAEHDNIKGISASVLCGQVGTFGTNMFDVYLDLNEYKNISDIQKEKEKSVDIEKLFDDIEDTTDYCSTSNITISNSASIIQEKDLGNIDNDFDIEI